jgi:hypothetical protein
LITSIPRDTKPIIWRWKKPKLLGDAAAKAGAAEEAAAGLLNPKAETSPPKEIQALRDSFENTLEELGVTLMVPIDDLDRCLPETTISTLEAIRLFLFLKNTRSAQGRSEPGGLTVLKRINSCADSIEKCIVIYAK